MVVKSKSNLPAVLHGAAVRHNTTLQSLRALLLSTEQCSTDAPRECEKLSVDCPKRHLQYCTGIVKNAGMPGPHHTDVSYIGTDTTVTEWL